MSSIVVHLDGAVSKTATEPSDGEWKWFGEWFFVKEKKVGLAFEYKVRIKLPLRMHTF